MKQLIKLTATVPNDRYEIRLDAVYQKDDMLFVLASLSNHGGWGRDDYQELSEKLVVNTNASVPLPVVYVMTGVDKPQVDRLSVLRTDYVSHYKLQGEGATQFVVIAGNDQIMDVLQEATLLHRHKRNKLSSFRLEMLAPKRPDMTFVDMDKFSEGAVLNIFPMVSEGELSLVFESISLASRQNDANLFPLAEALNTIVLRIDRDLSLDFEYFMECDKDIYFDAMYQGAVRRFHSHAVSLVMPAEDILSAMKLFNITNIATHLNEVCSRFAQSYRQVLLSDASVLQCYQKPLMTYQYLNVTQSMPLPKKVRFIVNDLPVSMESFLASPNHKWQLQTSAQALIEMFMQLQTIPKYALLQIFIREFYPLYGDKIITDPIACFEDKCQIDLHSLLNLDMPQAEREVLVAKDEKLLLESGAGMYRDYFLKTFHQAAVIVLVSQCFDKNAPGGRRYNMTYTEIELLRLAEYTIRSDGRMSIDMLSNPTFKKYYAEGCRLFVECESEFRNLATSLGLAFADDTNFHRELIFTPASTQKLKALGLHLTEKYLRLCVQQREAACVTNTPFGLYRSASVEMFELEGNCVMENNL